MDRDPGPLDYFEPSAIRPMPARPSFEGIAAGALADVPGLDAQFLNARAELANTAGNVNDGFEGELADAIGDGVNPPGDDVPLETATTIGSGDGLDGIRQSVQDTLPPTNTPIDLGFDEPPPPPEKVARPVPEDKNPTTDGGIT